MTQILLIRHAVNEYVKTGKLAGRIEGVHLNDDGKAQAAALGKRLADTPLKHIYASRMERTMETAQAIHEYHPDIPLEQHDGIKGHGTADQRRSTQIKNRGFSARQKP